MQQSVATAQQLQEGELEDLVEDGVDDGVEGAGHVAQPHEDREEGGGEVAVRAEHGEDVDEEEGCPAYHKDHKHHPQHLGGPLLCLHRGVFADEVLAHQEDVGRLDGHVVLADQLLESLGLTVLRRLRTPFLRQPAPFAPVGAGV